MAFIAAKMFRGHLPRLDKSLLQPNQAQRAWNCRIQRGVLEPITKPGLLLTLPGNTTIRSARRYRHVLNTLPVDNWLTWGNDVDYVPSPTLNTADGLFYFTSEDFEPRMSSYAMAIGAPPYPSAWYALGVPNPVTGPTLAPSGGSGDQETRAYVYTFVTALGEESGPSPASAVLTGYINGTWALSGMQTAPPNSGTIVGAVADSPMDGQVTVELNTVFGLAAHESITIAGVTGMTDLNRTHRIQSIDVATKKVVLKLDTAQVYTAGGTWDRQSPLNTTGMRKRIYRTAGTDPAFLFVDEIAVATTTYNDAVASTGLGEVLALTVLPPPKNLTCLTPLPNGCLVGISDNQICFSEPYKPYSWPVGYRYAFSGKGMALCPAGSSVVLLTDSYPILWTGDPGLMSPSRIETYAPCMSKRGTVDVGGGCLYPSNDGLWLVSPTVVRKLTEKLFTVEQWDKLNPSSFDAGFFGGEYFTQYTNDLGESRVLIIDTEEPDGVIEVDDVFDSFYRNQYDGQLYLSKGNKLFIWEGADGEQYESDWMGGEGRMGTPCGFSIGQVFADFEKVQPIDTTKQDANLALMASATMGGGHICGLPLGMAPVAGSLLEQLTTQTQRRVQVTLYRKGLPIFTKDLTSTKPFRVKFKGKSELYSLQVSASVPCNSVVFAGSIEELKKVPP